MTIETKHSINEEVWVMHKNKPKQSKIMSIIVEINENLQVTEKYSLKDITLPENKSFHPYFTKLFKTKEELIQSL